MFLGLKRLIIEEAKKRAIKPLSFKTSKAFSFNFCNAWLLLLEDSVKVFIKFPEVFFIVPVTGSNTFLYSGESFVSLICLVLVLLLLDFIVKLAHLIFLILLYS